MNIFLTGGNGMLGRAVSRIACEHFPDLKIAAPSRSELDLTDVEAVNRFYAAHKFDTVIHSAAKVGGIAANIAEPVEFLIQNLRLNDNVIMGANQADVPKLIFLGSSCMYPKDYRQPLTEDDLLAAPLEPTNEGYALSKITGAKLCEYISQKPKRAYRTIVPCNLFGTDDHFGSDASHLIAAIVTKVVDAQANGRNEISIWGSGKARREFLFVDDLVTFILENLDKVEDFPNTLNVGYGTDHSIDDYYKAVADIAKYTGTFKYDLTKPEGMMQKLMDSSLATEEFNWSANTSLKEAIAKVINAYKEQKQQKRWTGA
jgi:GDP-L-fucose synthase